MCFITLTLVLEAFTNPIHINRDSIKAMALAPGAHFTVMTYTETAIPLDIQETPACIAYKIATCGAFVIKGENPCEVK